MDIYQILQDKKEGKALSCRQISFLIEQTAKGTIPDYQVSAFLMAAAIRGLNAEETYHLTDAMAKSGKIFDFSAFPMSADKHSTGGVGDSTTGIVISLLHALGFQIAKMSGRGLGFTGGTIDKFETVEGMRLELGESEFMSLFKKHGLVIAAQSDEICPADKRLYALRDVTATVDSIPLIAASVMSKKIACGAQNIVIDVKCGDAAFMRNLEDAKHLAATMVDIGKRFGRNISALVTAMDQPLDRYIGNALELSGVLEVLAEKRHNRLRTVSEALAEEILILQGFSDARRKVSAAIEDGSALASFRQMIANQGGKTDWIDRPEMLKKAEYSFDIFAAESGYIARIDARKLAEVVRVLGGGRFLKEDKIKPYVGIELFVEVGQSVEEGTLLAKMYYSDYDQMLLCKEVADSFGYSKKPPEKQALILEIIR